MPIIEAPYCILESSELKLCGLKTFVLDGQTRVKYLTPLLVIKMLIGLSCTKILQILNV